MEANNNNERWQDHQDSLGDAIRSISYPFDSVQERLEVIQECYHATDMPAEKKNRVFKEVMFKKYFEQPEKYNFYGIFIPEPETL